MPDKPRHLAYCPDCDLEMERGYVRDRTSVLTSHAVPPTWAPGTVETSVVDGSVKGSPFDALPIITFRCPKCGQLKSFAPPA